MRAGKHPGAVMQAPGKRRDLSATWDRVAWIAYGVLTTVVVLAGAIYPGAGVT
jgi:hypothetical protein